ncbi:MAG: hypothetical protein EXR72_08980 [Myxococcales bacterium]|nr:hypothetical protein [Myxococcales bacterium]
MAKPPKQSKTATPPRQGELGWQAHPTVESGERGSSEAVAPKATAAAPEQDFTLRVEVEPRKPRLAWQGMDRRELAVSVPTQVVEIVWPGRAMRREGELWMDTRTVVQRDTSSLPPNRLIWTTRTTRRSRAACSSQSSKAAPCMWSSGATPPRGSAT